MRKIKRKKASGVGFEHAPPGARFESNVLTTRLTRNRVAVANSRKQTFRKQKQREPQKRKKMQS